MTKKEALNLFDNNISQLCRDLYICRQTFYRWPDPLPQAKVDQIVGAKARINEGQDAKLVYVIDGFGG